MCLLIVYALIYETLSCDVECVWGTDDFIGDGCRALEMVLRRFWFYVYFIDDRREID